MLIFCPSIVADRWVHSTYAFLRFRAVLVFNQNSGCTQLVCHIVFNRTGATVSLPCPDELAKSKFFATATAIAPHLCHALQSRSEHAEGVQRRAAQSRSQLARHRQSHPSDPAARGGPAAAAYFGALRGSARSAAAAANFRPAVRFPAGGRLCWRSSKRVSLRGAPCGARAQAAEALRPPGIQSRWLQQQLIA